MTGASQAGRRVLRTYPSHKMSNAAHASVCVAPNGTAQCNILQGSPLPPGQTSFVPSPFQYLCCPPLPNINTHSPDGVHVPAPRCSAPSVRPSVRLKLLPSQPYPRAICVPSMLPASHLDYHTPSVLNSARAGSLTLFVWKMKTATFLLHRCIAFCLLDKV